MNSVNVDYAPNSRSAFFIDGSPCEIKMDLNFMQAFHMHRAMVLRGFLMFFSELPTIPFINKDGSQSNLRDIIRRVIFSDESYLNISNYDYYTVKDTDTPDSIARDFYDNPDYHWVIILYNNAFDPFLYLSAYRSKT